MLFLAGWEVSGKGKSKEAKKEPNKSQNEDPAGKQGLGKKDEEDKLILKFLNRAVGPGLINLPGPIAGESLIEEDKPENQLE